MKRKAAVWMLVPALLVGFAVGANASNGLEKITANLNHNLKFKIDGKAWKPTKDDGTAIAPITYQGTTYLPARAVADALNVAVNYDGDTSTVLLGEVLEGTSVIEAAVETSGGITRTKDANKTTIGGVKYKEVFYAEDVSSYVGEYMIFYPKKKYQTLYLQMASVQQDLHILVYEGDGEVQILDTSVEKGTDMSTIEIDVGGLETFYVELRTYPEAEFSDVVIPITSYYQ